MTIFDRREVITVSRRAVKVAMTMLISLAINTFPGVILGSAGGLVSE